MKKSVMILVLTASALLGGLPAEADRCSCASAYCSASISCTGGCYAICGTRCSSGCQGGGGGDRGPLSNIPGSPLWGEGEELSLHCAGASEEEVSAQLSAAIGAPALFRGPSSLSIEVSNLATRELLRELSRYGGTVAVFYGDPDHRRGANVSVVGQSVDPEQVTEIVEFLTGHAVRFTPDSAEPLRMEANMMDLVTFLEGLARHGELKFVE